MTLPSSSKVKPCPGLPHGSTGLEAVLMRGMPCFRAFYLFAKTRRCPPIAQNPPQFFRNMLLYICVSSDFVGVASKQYLISPPVFLVPMLPPCGPHVQLRLECITTHLDDDGSTENALLLSRRKTSPCAKMHHVDLRHRPSIGNPGLLP